MLSIAPVNSILPIILFIIGIAIFVGTLVSVWQNRRRATTQRATKLSCVVALAVGLLALVYWTLRVDEPVFPMALIAIPVLFMAPTFITSFYFSLAWLKRSDTGEGQT